MGIICESIMVDHTIDIGNFFNMLNSNISKFQKLKKIKYFQISKISGQFLSDFENLGYHYDRGSEIFKLDTCTHQIDEL